MYIPKLYLAEDRARILEFMRAHEFITLVVCEQGRPLASHLLVEVSEEKGEVQILGHMSKANPIWKLFDEKSEGLVIFEGPHAYISPTWYNHVNVPTWNYQSVHAYGIPRPLTGPEYQAALSRLVARHEGSSAYRLESLPPDYVEKNINGTVGFKIRVDRLEAAYKLSQNRDDEDHRRIILELEKRADELSHQVAAEMRKNRPA
jgi:transcriptional regulator